MSSNIRVKCANYKLDASNAVNLSKVVFDHADNSLLQDLNNVKSSLTAGDVLKFDGTNIIALQNVVVSSDLAPYAESADVASTYETISNVTTLAGRVSTLETDSATHLTSADLAPYAQSADVASTYETISNVTTLAGRVTTLETDSADYLTSADLTGYAQTNDIEITYATKQDPQVIGTITHEGTQNNLIQKTVMKYKACASNATETLCSIPLSMVSAQVGMLKAKCYITSDSARNGVVNIECGLSVAGGVANVISNTYAYTDSGDLHGGELQVSTNGANVLVNCVGNSTTSNMKVAGEISWFMSDA
jgi:hypothetical protein